MHFEELWGKSEEFIKKNLSDESLEEILKSIMMQISVYKTLSEKEVPPDELKALKNLLIGEILFSFTKLSLKDDIDVFNALHMALKSHILEFSSK